MRLTIASLLGRAKMAIRRAASCLGRLRTPAESRPPNPSCPATVLREGDARLAVVLDGKVLVHTSDVSLSHAEFVRRTLGSLPRGAWVGTLRKSGGEVVVMNSRTFYGNQLPAPQDIADAVRAEFA